MTIFTQVIQIYYTCYVNEYSKLVNNIFMILHCKTILFIYYFQMTMTNGYTNFISVYSNYMFVLSKCQPIVNM